MRFMMLGAVLAAVPAAADLNLTPKTIYEKDAPSVVLILAAAPGAEGGELGTGSVIDTRGRVLTNAHVVIDQKTGRPYPQIRVFLKPKVLTGDRRQDLNNPIIASVERYDRPLDLALLKLEENPGRPPIVLGDDSAVSPGDAVVAIGHPEQGGFWTLTQGVVSTVVAGLGGVSGKDAFQTDASINRGNSGGPLIDRSGSIVGINTAMARKASDGLAITSVNFSIKSSVARRWLAGEAPPPAVAMTEPAPQAPAAAPAIPAPPTKAPTASTTAPAAPTPPATPPATPAPALPPPPKTKPVILTPIKPYNAEKVLAAEMAEMDSLGEEMRTEIERHAQ